MVWAFIWRFALYVGGLSTISTFLVGFAFGAAQADTSTARDVATVVQVLAVGLAAVLAWFNARDTRPKTT